jgi:hypothetical protein
MIDKIEIDKDVFVYRIKKTLIHSKDEILNKIEKNSTYANIKQLKEDGSYNVGIQSPFIIRCNELNEIENTANEIAKEIYGYDSFINNTWSFMLESDYKFPLKNEDENGWHDHLKVFALNNKLYKSNVTFIYYLQLPNNLKNDDGMLSFRINNGKIIRIMPEEGEYVVFSSDVMHRAELSPNSTIPRIVIAGNIHFVKNIKIKKEISLI